MNTEDVDKLCEVINKLVICLKNIFPPDLQQELLSEDDDGKQEQESEE